MLTVELTEKDLNLLLMLVEKEIKENDDKILNLKSEYDDYNYCFIVSLQCKNEMLMRTYEKLSKEGWER